MAFNKDIPTAGTSLRASNPQILENQESTQEAVNNEHIFSGTDAGTQTGDHTQGSARCFSQAGAPATRIDGDNFLSTDLGSLWVDTDDNALYILTATVPTWTPVSTEVIATLLASNRIFAGTLGVTSDFDVNTDKFTVDSATGNTVVAGTLDAQTSLKLATGATVTEFSTDDTLAGDSDTAVPTEKSTKAYVDAIKYYGGGYDFGGNTNLTSSYATLITFTDTFSGKPVSWSLAGGWNGNTTGGQVTIRVRNSSGYSEEFVLNVDTGSGTTFRDSFGYGFGDILTSLESGTGSVTVTIEAKQSGGGGQVGVGHSAFIFQECDR